MHETWIHYDNSDLAYQIRYSLFTFYTSQAQAGIDSSFVCFLMFCSEKSTKKGEEKKSNMVHIIYIYIQYNTEQYRTLADSNKIYFTNIYIQLSCIRIYNELSFHHC